MALLRRDYADSPSVEKRGEDRGLSDRFCQKPLAGVPQGFDGERRDPQGSVAGYGKPPCGRSAEPCGYGLREEGRREFPFRYGPDTDPRRRRLGACRGYDAGCRLRNRHGGRAGRAGCRRSGTRSGRVSFHRRRGDRSDRRFRPRRGHAEREISDQSRLGGRGPAFHRLRRRNRHGSDDALSSGGGAEELRFFPHRHRRPFGRSLGRRHRQGTGQFEQTARPLPVAGGAADGNEAGIPRRRKSPQRDSPRGFRRIRRTVARRQAPSGAFRGIRPRRRTGVRSGREVDGNHAVRDAGARYGDRCRCPAVFAVCPVRAAERGTGDEPDDAGHGRDLDQSGVGQVRRRPSDRDNDLAALVDRKRARRSGRVGRVGPAARRRRRDAFGRLSGLGARPRVAFACGDDRGL